MASTVDTPQSMKRKDLLAMHGPSGWLITRLQRYSLLGWLLFALTALALVGLSFLHAIKPVPVIAVDENGQVLGTIEYLDATARSDQELVGGAKTFVSGLLSANAATIWDDYAAAASMMTPELYEREKAPIEDGSLIKIEKSGARSHVAFDNDKTALVHRNGLAGEVRLVGAVIIGQDSRKEVKFDLSVDLLTVARSPTNTTGIKVRDYWYN